MTGEKEEGEVWVPEGNGVVVEWDEAFGIPTATEDIALPHIPYTTHFYFSPTPEKGKHDVALGRRSGWLLDEHKRCLYLSAGSRRSGAAPVLGFRPVRGPFPEIEAKEIEKIVSEIGAEKISAEVLEKAQRIDPREIEEALLERMRKDYMLADSAYVPT